MADTSTPAELRETERRVLGNLPAYRTREGRAAAVAEALEYGTIRSADEWPRSRTVADLTRRLAADRHCAAVDAVAVSINGPEDAEKAVRVVLDDLVNRGLADQDGEQFRMTEAGLRALTA